MSDDPFDDLDPDEYREREGDPFESLADDPTESDETDPAEESGPDADAGPAGANNADAGPAGASDADTDPAGATGPDAPAAEDPPVGRSTGTDGDDPDPFEYLADPAEERPRSADDRTPEGDAPGGSGEGNGEGRDRSVDVAANPFGDVDVSRGDPFESADNPFERVDVDGVDPDELWLELTSDDRETGPADPPEDDVVDVSKHRFCEVCPHFSAPPSVECTHEGTEILAFLDPDEVRVRNCPVVGERRELGEVHE
jgi:hypothetical protein